MKRNEQWGDKAADLEAENGRFKQEKYNKQIKSKSYTYQKSKRKSNSFFSLMFKAFLIVFIIWFITTIMK
ncbi:hypothetical protein [uncultured Aquimarina sp.]|uniref:hypothetical protein n=1 Tax=uncultured Aquimarina sp. TaxID=575652 RepID=UPI0026315A63|nr:hypothetical protein [uncultured Aquimarina sp.]